MTTGTQLSRARMRFRAAVEAHVLPGGSRELVREMRRLSERYRTGEAAPQARSAGEVLAYAAGRLPATHAAVLNVLGRFFEVDPDFAPESLLDVGAGPGTASWAACEVFASIGRVDLLESAPEMIAVGRKLCAAAEFGALREAEWHSQTVTAAPPVRADLVVASYVLGELAPRALPAAVGHWWDATLARLVLVEPGTPGGFARIRAARDLLLGLGAHTVAPCPHDVPCPMAEGDWCHFRQRVERSPLQRAAKEGLRGYEDEKFSYAVLSRDPVATQGSRVLRHRHGKGRVELTICTRSGIEDVVVGKRDASRYARARRADWGDLLDD